MTNPLLPARARWKVNRARLGAIRLGRLPAEQLAQVQDEAILGALAMAEVEHGVADPAALAAVIDWAALRRDDETLDSYLDRLGAAVADDPARALGAALIICTAIVVVALVAALGAVALGWL